MMVDADDSRTAHNERDSSYVKTGQAYDRDMTYLSDRITADGSSGYQVEPGRYRLIVSRACPWANRAMIARRLYGLEEALPMGIAGPTHDARSWTFDLDPEGLDPVLGIHFLRDAFNARIPDYPRGVTVPAIVDVPSGQVVTNDFQQITLDLGSEWKAFHRPGAPDLYPEHLRNEMDELMEFIFRTVNNGVYQCGFAGSQETYDHAYDELWAALDVLEERLATRRYLMGESITEADVRLYPTLVRFDAVYFAHFKANRQPLLTMPNLWGYARDLFQTPGFGDTNDFEHIKSHYYGVHRDINPSGIVPKGPALDGWLSNPGRAHLPTNTWGDGGTPPGPPPVSERPDPEHTPLRILD